LVVLIAASCRIIKNAKRRNETATEVKTKSSENDGRNQGYVLHDSVNTIVMLINWNKMALFTQHTVQTCVKHFLKAFA